MQIWHDIHCTLRQITLKKKKNEKKVTAFLKEKILSFQKGSDFENWHHEVCDKIVSMYSCFDGMFSYGQAQKWLNMLIKYIYVYDIKEIVGESVEVAYSEFFDKISGMEVLHAPIDSKVIDIAKEKINLNRPKTPWSKMDYALYVQYQRDLKDKLSQENFSNPDEKIAFYWEMINWE